VVAIMDPYGQDEALKGLAGAGVSAFSMELMPRITRAPGHGRALLAGQLAGYRAVIDAAAEYGRAMPDDDDRSRHDPRRPASSSWVPASRACRPSRPRRRLGAVVTATDVRPAAKEQVESLGAKFVAVEDEEFKQAETAGGYAKEMSAEYRAKQARWSPPTSPSRTS
jgi:NAD(P) transhydrogenase subunit alpha